jgi:hypothetical protein
VAVGGTGVEVGLAGRGVGVVGAAVAKATIRTLGVGVGSTEAATLSRVREAHAEIGKVVISKRTNPITPRRVCGFRLISSVPPFSYRRVLKAMIPMRSVDNTAG